MNFELFMTFTVYDDKPALRVPQATLELSDASLASKETL